MCFLGSQSSQSILISIIFCLLSLAKFPFGSNVDLQCFFNVPNCAQVVTFCRLLLITPISIGTYILRSNVALTNYKLKSSVNLDVSTSHCS